MESRFQFQTWIVDGEEYFCYDDADDMGSAEPRKIVKHFPVMQSLMEYCYLDTSELAEYFSLLQRVIKRDSSMTDETVVDAVKVILDDIAEKHIYLEFLRLKVLSEIRELREGRRKKLNGQALLDGFYDDMGSQGKLLWTFENCLNVDRAPKDEWNTFTYGDSAFSLYESIPLTTRFEKVGEDIYAEVLRPDSISEMVEFFIRECARRKLRVRQCKHCGRWFFLTGHQGVEYCDRLVDDKGRTCRDVGATHVWERKQNEDVIFKEYRREYKKRFAWIKAGKISQEDFYAWGETAREKKVECDDGTISLDEFKDWLRKR